MTDVTLSNRFLQSSSRNSRTRLVMRACPLFQLQCRTRRPSCPCVPVEVFPWPSQTLCNPHSICLTSCRILCHWWPEEWKGCESSANTLQKDWITTEETFIEWAFYLPLGPSNKEFHGQTWADLHCCYQCGWDSWGGKRSQNLLVWWRQWALTWHYFLSGRDESPCSGEGRPPRPESGECTEPGPALGEDQTCGQEE